MKESLLHIKEEMIVYFFQIKTNVENHKPIFLFSQNLP